MPCSSDGNSNEVGPFGIDYVNLYECEFREFQSFGIILFLCWILYLIFLLGNTAENYLSPTLALLCDKLNLSYNVAGITFLAFGNATSETLFAVPLSNKYTAPGEGYYSVVAGQKGIKK